MIFEPVTKKRSASRRPIHRINAGLTGKKEIVNDETFLQSISKSGREFWVKENDICRCANPMVFQKIEK